MSGVVITDNDNSVAAACILCVNSENLTQLFTKEEYTYWLCQNCDLVFTSPQPSIAEQKNALAEWAGMHHLSRERLEWEFSSTMGLLLYGPRLRPIEKLLPERGNLLDVGCSAGGFLDYARSNGWDVRGVELAKESAHVANTDHDLDVVTKPVEEVEWEVSSFDAITFWDVIEHHPDPAVFIGKASELLRPGGIIALATPNYNSLTRYIIGERWDALIPPRHLYVFTQASIRKLLGQAGFKIIKLTTIEINPMEIAVRRRTTGEESATRDATQKRLANAKEALAGQRVVRLGRALANSVLNATGSGDVLTVYARKN